MITDDPSFESTMRRWGLDEEYLLSKTEELIKAIKSGKYRPLDTEKELSELWSIKSGLLKRIKMRGRNG